MMLSQENKVNQLVEKIEFEQVLIAYIIRADKLPEKTEFITPDEVKQQVGFIVYPKGGEIPRHIHLPIERHLTGTSEVLLLRKGKAEVDFYTQEKEFICTRTLEEGDLLLLVNGGHGFRCLEDTVFMEIKQGPYTGLVEKERF